MNERKEHLVADFAKIKPTPCPCGQSKRAFVQDGNQVASMHMVEISKDNVLTTTRKRPRFTMSWREKGIWKSRRTKSRSSPGFPSSSHLTTCTGPWGNSKFSMFRFLRSIRRTNGLSIEVRSTGSSRRTCPESWWSGSTGFRSGRSRPTWKWEKKCLFLIIQGMTKNIGRDGSTYQKVPGMVCYFLGHHLGFLDLPIHPNHAKDRNQRERCNEASQQGQLFGKPLKSGR